MPVAVVLLGQSNAARNAKNLLAALQAEYGPDTVLIVCARGGHSLAMLSAYLDADIALIRDYQASGFTVVSIFMELGESDARIGTAGAAYKTGALAYINAIRLGIGIPFLRVVLAQLGRVPANWNAANWVNIQRAHAEMLVGHDAFRMFATAQYGPYEKDRDGKEIPHYHDNVADPLWDGTGYKEIARDFMAQMKAALK
jgi:hypothetical protein